MKKNKKGFTLIELIVILVILAVIALIVTPLIMNVVKGAQINSRKSSIDGYGKAAELAVASYKLDTGSYPTSFEQLSINYQGKTVKCETNIINHDGTIFLSKCMVNDIYVEDKETEDGYYQFGTLANEYNIGDKITFNGVDFYVIKPSNALTEYVTLLKADAFTYDELLTYGEGHVNMYNYRSNYNYSGSYYRVPNNVNGYGYMAYYTSPTCGYDDSGNYSSDGCTNDYAVSEVKYVVDKWVNEVIKSENLTADDLGYKSRLITFEELTEYLGYENVNASTVFPSSNGETPSFVYDSDYGYWTMSPSGDSLTSLYTIMANGGIYFYSSVTDTSYSSQVGAYAVRPVINLNKKVIKE